VSANSSPKLRRLEEKLAYSFRRPILLQQALTHKSFAYEAGGDCSFHNESMEFLGDAVLGFLVTDLIYHTFPTVSEGRLSKIKGYLVSSAMLSSLALELDLQEHLRLGKGEEKTGGRKKKALSANALEAVVAAVYLDGGIESARELLAPLYSSAVDEIREGRAVVEDPKTTLQEYLQGRGLPPARYMVTFESGPDHQKTFHVELVVGEKQLAKACGATKKKAELQTAQAALEQLRKDGEVDPI